MIPKTAKPDSRISLRAASFLAAIKEILKERGLTYATLANELGCSLPTIKRSLNKPSLPLSRLLEIADVAGVKLEEICERANQLRPKHYVFTSQQDELFAERAEVLAYFVELAVNNKTPREIARDFGLDTKSSETYQKLLEEVGLLRRKARNQVSLLFQPPFGFDAQGTFMKRQCRAFLESIIEDVVESSPPNPLCTAILKPLSLSTKDHSRMIGRLVELIDQFSAISERQISDDETSNWQVAIACGPSRAPGNVALPQIRN